jgi:hypothetical protein
MAAVSVVVIMVAMVVAPSPIFLLLFRAQLVEVTIAVVVRLVGPAVIVHGLVTIPPVIVGVVGVVNAVRMMFTGDSRQRRS